jgi:hypothetical protein
MPEYLGSLPLIVFFVKMLNFFENNSAKKENFVKKMQTLVNKSD